LDDDDDDFWVEEEVDEALVTTLFLATAPRDLVALAMMIIFYHRWPLLLWMIDE
jgi:hypothetical protein